MQPLVPQWDRCLNVNCDMWRSCVLSAIHMPHIHQNQYKVLYIRVFVALFFFLERSDTKKRFLTYYTAYTMSIVLLTPLQVA
jgi:hypothetical protein